MNKQLEEFARNTLKTDLAKCTDKEKDVFIRMYSPGQTPQFINDVVNTMPVEKLDWAMTQVQNTLANKEIVKL